MQLTTSEHQILHGEGMVDAIYSNQIVQDYESNPLIEALPPIFTEDEVIEQISVFPPFDEKERKLNQVIDSIVFRDCFNTFSL